MLREMQSKDVVRGRMELHERGSTMNENKNPKDRRLPGLREEEQGRLNVNSKGVAIVGEERGVGESGHDFWRCRDFKGRTWRGRGSCLSLGKFSFLLLFNFISSITC